VSRTAAKTHLGRQAAAQKGKEAGVSESDIKKHGIWNQGVARGAYEAAIPNRDAIVALSSRPLSTTSPTTPRYKVPVPLALQATMCPWLEAEEKAYHERLAADKYCIDEALVNFFGLMRWARSAFFQSWAARFATGRVPDDSYIRQHPLRAHPLFEKLGDLMVRTLSGVAQSAVSAVEQMIPQLAPVVEAVVEASAVAAMADLHRHERYMVERVDTGFAGVNTEADNHAAALKAQTAAAVAAIRRQNEQQHKALTAQVSHLQEMVLCLAQGRTSAMPLPPSQGLSTPALSPCDGASPRFFHGAPPRLSAPSLSAAARFPPQPPPPLLPPRRPHLCFQRAPWCCGRLRLHLRAR